eukprot:1290882-Amphidinium_carterae.1
MHNGVQAGRLAMVLFWGFWRHAHCKAQIYESLLQLYSVHDKDQAGLQGPIGQIPLRGKGVRPVLKILPENGILQLGAVIHTKDLRETFT